MAKNFLNLRRYLDIQVHEANRLQIHFKTREKIIQCVIIILTHYNKTAKIKAKEKKIVIYKGVPVKLSVHFSTEILQAREDWNDIFNVTPPPKKKPTPNTLSGIVTFKNEGEIEFLLTNSRIHHNHICLTRNAGRNSSRLK